MRLIASFDERRHSKCVNRRFAVRGFSADRSDDAAAGADTKLFIRHSITLTQRALKTPFRQVVFLVRTHGHGSYPADRQASSTLGTFSSTSTRLSVVRQSFSLSLIFCFGVAGNGLGRGYIGKKRCKTFLPIFSMLSHAADRLCLHVRYQYLLFAER